MSETKGFRNKYYNSKWQKFVGNSKREYADGTYAEEGGKYAVYDGATNFMGFVNKNGTFDSDGNLTEYKASFLKSAKEVLVEAGLVGTMSGDNI